MRAGLTVILGCVAAISLSACEQKAQETANDETPAETVPTPTRKPGLWKQTMTVEDMGIKQDSELCLDEKADKQLAWWAQQGPRAVCEKNQVSQNPDGSWSFSSSCEMPGGIRTTTTGMATGDFQSSYQLRAESTTVGSPITQMNASHTVLLDAKWAGECPNGMKPGDIRLPGGQSINALEIGKDPLEAR